MNKINFLLVRLYVGLLVLFRNYLIIQMNLFLIESKNFKGNKLNLTYFITPTVLEAQVK
jgi:hypothetical protein